MASICNKTVRMALVAALTMCLVACATPEHRGPAAVIDRSDAQRELDAGNYSEAALLWQEAAVDVSGAERDIFRLQSAEAWMLAGKPAPASEQLGQVNDGQLSTSHLARFALLNAELSLQSADTQSAEFYLEIASSRLNATLQTRYSRLRDRVQRLRTDPANFAISTAVAALGAMNSYRTHDGVAILQLLEDVPSDTLVSYSSDGRSGLGDWAQLTVILRQALVAGAELNAAAASWARSHPGHVVTESGFVDLARLYQQMFALPSRIAVLLPVTGGLSASGRAIRDGLVSAYLDHPRDITLKFYATEEDPQSAVSSYFQAMKEGAQWVIGPLKKEAVNALTALGSLGAPVLLLNNSDNKNSATGDSNLLFSVSLSQEAEAEAIAHKALENGWRRAVSITSDDPWGQRMEAAFSQAFVSGGGLMTAATQFGTSENDHSNLLTRLLQIDESRERGARLQATLGIQLNFEPSRRDDFDLIFLAANPTQGRQIRPQLRFYDAGAKPVMAMSRVFNGQIDQTADQDLNGIVFPSTRLQLAGTGFPYPESLSSLRGGSFAPLYALGLDAWNVLPWLPLMRKDPDLRFEGALGTLFLGPGGQILRDPAWARFSGGRPSPVVWNNAEE